MIHSMTGDRRTDRLVPTHPSNKNVMEQCLLWGWTIRAHTSEWVELQHEDRADRIRVRPVTHHSDSRGDVLSQVYKITCNGDAAAFWRREQPYHTKVRNGGGKQTAAMTDEEMEAYAERMRREKPQSILDRLDRAAGLRDVPEPKGFDVMEDVTPPREIIMRPRMASGIRNVGAYERPAPNTFEAEVLEVLERANLSELSLNVLKALCPHLERGQLSNIVKRLAERGFMAYGSGRGYYLYTPPPKVVEPPAPTAARPAVESTPAATPTPAPAPANSAHEDTVDALLDLMFPDGVRTRHLGALDEWRRRTLDLLREIHGD